MKVLHFVRCIIASVLLLLCLSLALPDAVPVRADVGVQPILPGGASISPEEQTPIQMAGEVVEMTVRAAAEGDNTLIYGIQGQTAWYPGVAEVTADFHMLNPTADDISLTAWFPLASALENVDWELNPEETVPRIANFQVSVNGVPLDFQVTELPNPKGAEKPPLPWASFPVTFTGGVETLIHVSYSLGLQPSIKGHEMALYYIFQTGAGWDGPIGQAELIVNLPYPASKETLAGIPPGGMHLPPFGISNKDLDLPAGAVIEGNTVRWLWTDLEPGPEDDFAIWLLQPSGWQALETARAAVQQQPEDGRTWLDLACVVHSLAISGYNNPSLFSAAYLPQGIEAYQKAAELLPEHPAPPAGLGLLTLAPYMRNLDAPDAIMQQVQDDYQLAADLEAQHPTLQDESGICRGLLFQLEDTLNIYAYNQEAAITATADAASTTSAQDTATAAAVTETPTPVSSTTPTPIEATTTPVLASTPQPTPAITGTNTDWQLPAGIAAGSVIILSILIYWLVKRRGK